MLCRNTSQRGGIAVHEMSIAQSLLEIILEESRKHDLTSVQVVRLQIGAMAGVVPEALTFCFDLLTRDTPASGATPRDRRRK